MHIEKFYNSNRLGFLCEYMRILGDGINTQSRNLESKQSWHDYNVTEKEAAHI